MRFLKIILIIVLFSLVIVSATFKINDPDTVHYLATGRNIVEHGLSDMCFFNYPSHQCQTVFFHEWLFHLVTYIVYIIGQWNGLVLFQIFLVFSNFLILFIHSRKFGYSLFSTSIFFLAAIFAAAERFMLRADLFGLLMVILFYFYLKSFLQEEFYLKKGFKKVILFFPFVLITVLWANTHGSFTLAFVIICVFIFSNIIKSLWQKYILAQSVLLYSNETKALVTILILTLIFGLVNPFGPKAFFGAFNFFSIYVKTLAQQNLEWQSPFTPSDFMRTSIFTYKLLIVGMFSLILLNIKKIKFVDIFLLVFLFYLSVNYVRNIALFALFSVLIFPYYLDNVIVFIKKIIGIKREYLVVIGQYIIIVILIFFCSKLIYDIATNSFHLQDQRSRRFGIGISEIVYPINAVEFIKKNNIKGNMFNDYGIGAYLNWAIYPSQKSFIDGDTFSVEFLDYYNQIVNGLIPYQEVVEKYDINYFILNHIHYDTLNFISKLSKDKDWVLIYFDEISAIFIANKVENEFLIDKYAIDFNINNNFDLNSLKSIKEKINLSTGYFNRGVFFSNLLMHEKAENQFKKAVEYDPKNYAAHLNLGAAYDQLGKDDQALEEYQKSIEIQSHFAPSHFNLGLIFQKRKFFDSAIQEYKKTLSINRDYKTANYNLGVIFEAKGDLNTAKKYYEHELKINPNDTFSQNALTRIQTSGPVQSQDQSKQNQPQIENIDKLQQLLDKNPEDPDLHFRLGIAYGLKEEHGKAKDEFHKAIELKPDFALAHFNLGNVYSTENNTQEARIEYEKAIEYDSKLADAYLNLGVIYRYQIRDNSKAVEYWQKYIDLNPKDPQSELIQQEIYKIVKEETTNK